MLGYPLMWGLSQSNQEKNLQHYKSVIPESSPSTAWSMLAINMMYLYMYNGCLLVIFNVQGCQEGVYKKLG